MREFSALDGDGFLGQAVSLFDDATGITKMTGTVLDFSFWKCMNCGRATSRNAKGEIKNVAKNS